MPFAQRRQEQRHHVKTVIQVFAETALRFCFQIAVGGGNHAHVNFDGARAPTRSSSPSCNTRSSLAWNARIFPRSRPGKPCRLRPVSKRPLRCAIAPVNAPFSMAEQFRFEQTFRQRGTVEFDVTAARAREL